MPSRHSSLFVFIPLMSSCRFITPNTTCMLMTLKLSPAQTWHPALRFTYQLMTSPRSFQVDVSELSMSKTLLAAISHFLPPESSLNRLMTSSSVPTPWLLSFVSYIQPIRKSYCLDLHVQIPKYFSYPCYHHPGLSHPHFLPRLLFYFWVATLMVSSV